MKQRGIAVEHWPWERKNELRMWLVENFGANGDRWGNEYDYGLENFWMDEDVYNWYILRWG